MIINFLYCGSSGVGDGIPCLEVPSGLGDVSGVGAGVAESILGVVTGVGLVFGVGDGEATGLAPGEATGGVAGVGLGVTARGLTVGFAETTGVGVLSAAYILFYVFIFYRVSYLLFSSN